MTKVAIPVNQVELEEMLADTSQLAAIVEQGDLADFVKAYAAGAMGAKSDLAVQVREQTQMVLTDWLKENGQDLERRSNLLDLRPRGADDHASRPTALYNPRAIGAHADINRLYADPAAMLQAIWHNPLAANSTKEARERLEVLRNYSESVPGAGGFLVPETLRSDLLQVSLEKAVVRPRARVVPMESQRVPFPKIDSTTNVGSVYGGITSYWVEESADLPESEASFGRAVLDAKKLITYAEAPNELVKDWSAFGTFIGSVMPEAMAFFEDLAFMGGSGVGMPTGALNPGNGAQIAVPIENGQQTATIVWQNVIKMFARMLPQSLSSAVWIATIDAFPELATMALSVGTGGGPVWLGGPNASGADTPPVTILGRPVIFTEKTPSALGGQGDLSFVDLSYYLIGDRQQMTAESSEHYKFKNDRTSYRITQRVDGRPWLDSAITPANGGPTLSPFVQLAARP